MMSSMEINLMKMKSTKETQKNWSAYPLRLDLDHSGAD